MPGMSFSVVPLGGPSYAASLATMRLGDAALHLCRSSPFMAIARTDADAAVLQFPLEATDSLVLNGVACPPGTIGVCGGGSEFLLANQEESWARGHHPAVRAGWHPPRAPRRVEALATRRACPAAGEARSRGSAPGA